MRMNNMAPSPVPPRQIHTDWLDPLFRAKSLRNRGVVRHKLSDLEREIGRDLLERQVRKRGLHMIESSGQLLTLCTSEPMRIIC